MLRIRMAVIITAALIGSLPAVASAQTMGSNAQGLGLASAGSANNLTINSPPVPGIAYAPNITSANPCTGKGVSGGGGFIGGAFSLAFQGEADRCYEQNMIRLLATIGMQAKRPDVLNASLAYACATDEKLRAASPELCNPPQPAPVAQAQKQPATVAAQMAPAPIAQVAAPQPASAALRACRSRGDPGPCMQASDAHAEVKHHKHINQG